MCRYHIKRLKGIISPRISRIEAGQIVSAAKVYVYTNVYMNILYECALNTERNAICMVSMKFYRDHIFLSLGYICFKALVFMQYLQEISCVGRRRDVSCIYAIDDVCAYSCCCCCCSLSSRCIFQWTVRAGHKIILYRIAPRNDIALGHKPALKLHSIYFIFKWGFFYNVIVIDS